MRVTAIMICLIISLTCQSQTITEPTIPVPQSVMVKTIKQLEVGKSNAELVAVLKEQTELLKQQIMLKDSMIKTYVAKDTLSQVVLQTYMQEVANLVEQRDIAIKAMDKQNKLLRRQKRKTTFVTIAGPALTAAALIYFKK